MNLNHCGLNHYLFQCVSKVESAEAIIGFYFLGLVHKDIIIIFAISPVQKVGDMAERIDTSAGKSSIEIKLIVN